MNLFLNLDLTTFFSLTLYLAGLIIGLGAIVVIEIHGFLGRQSGYWTQATTRTHKVTKPLIWTGFFLGSFGAAIFYHNQGINWIVLLQAVLLIPMFLNGLFLSFVVSPYLLKQEQAGKDTNLLPSSLQTKTTISFIISTITWWSQVFLLTLYLLN